MNSRERIGLTIIVVLCLLGFVAMLLITPIVQDLAYHQFADRRRILGVSNFWDVVSNLCFLMVGLVGINKLIAGHLTIIDDVKAVYFSFFTGIALVGLGSGYYHLWPANQTLFWDRLPMAIAFMSLVTIIIAEFICIKVAKVLFWPLLMLGALSVIYWIWTENLGQGDLRFYGLVQFLPLVCIPIILISFKSKFTPISGYWWLLLCYLAAKFFEHFDREVFNTIGLISGHSLKHIVAALGLWILLKNYQNRVSRFDKN